MTMFHVGRRGGACLGTVSASSPETVPDALARQHGFHSYAQVEEIASILLSEEYDLRTNAVTRARRMGPRADLVIVSEPETGDLMLDSMTGSSRLSEALAALEEPGAVVEPRERTAPERLARYLRAQAAHAEVGARLRGNGHQEDTWTPEDVEEWDAATAALEAAYRDVSDDERYLVDAADEILGYLCRGEMPPGGAA